MVTRYIIITGNPAGGFQYFGPFIDHDEAIAQVDEVADDGNWWIVPMQGPL